MGKSKVVKKGQTGRHKILDFRKHIYDKTMWTGSRALEEREIHFIENDEFILKILNIVPALLKIIDEVVDNSVDAIEHKRSGKIDVQMNSIKLSVKDNGDGIPIEDIEDLNGNTHLVPFSCWGMGMAGSNFMNDEEDATTRGTHGVGSYATNVLSNSFIGKTCDGKKEFIGIWKNNAQEYTETVKDKKTKGTTVTFQPDMELFKEINEITEDHILFVKQRLINLSVAYPNLTFTFNSENISYDKKKFLNHFGEHGEVFSNDKFSLGIFSNSTDDFKQFSLINGLMVKSGNHTEYIMKYLTEGIKEKLPKQYRDPKTGIKPGDIRNKLSFVFIGHSFPDIQWEGQVKETLKNTNAEVNKFLGPDWKSIIDKIIKNKPIMDSIKIGFDYKLKAQEALEAKKADKETKKVKALKFSKAFLEPKYYLVLEGDSAKKGAIAGLGRDYFSMYTVGGVVPNVIKNSMQKIVNNKEFKEMSSTLGFKFGEENSSKNLTHEKIVIMTDADPDGTNIAFLLLGFFKKFIPDIVDNHAIYLLKSPIKVAVDNKENMVAAFLTEEDYQEWLKKDLRNKKYKILYKKGLGSMSEEEWRQFYNLVPFEKCLYRITGTKEDFITHKNWMDDDAEFRKNKMTERIQNVKIKQLGDILQKRIIK